MLEDAVEEGVAYVPGEYFYATEEESTKNTMRLNYTLMNEEQIIEGIGRLRKVITKYSKD